MSPTYSINTGSSTEAVTYNNISDVLSGLPNNTNNQITPLDVRNAAFSGWESAVFKYTTNGSDSYIGIDRDDMKDKIFFGKKKLNSTHIITSTLASSNTDIFFYNTKSDSNPSQSTKIQFLAGSDASLHQYAPYISVQQVSGSTPSLSLNIVHTNPYGGDFNFQAGNNGRISLNGIVFPSYNEFTAMGSNQAVSSDRFLVRTSAGFIELKSASFSGTTLPTFTDSTPTPAEFGGIPSGTTFSNVELTEMIRSLLYPYLGPLSSITIPTDVRERNHVVSDSVYYEYSITKRSGAVTSQISFGGATPPIAPIVGPSIGGGSFVTSNYSATQSITNVQIQNSASGTFTFSVVVTDGTQSSTASTSVDYVYPYYYGFSATTSNPASLISAGTFSKLVDVYSDQSLAITGEGYLHFAYPASYGNLDKIYDGNGFLIYDSGTSSTSWTHSTVGGVSSDVGLWSGVSYKVYRTTDEVEITLPTQTYQFNF
jgi:hypothetical protein